MSGFGYNRLIPPHSPSEPTAMSHLPHRRTFLLGSASAAVAMYSFAHGADPAPSDRVRVGAVGIGVVWVESSQSQIKKVVLAKLPLQ